MWLVVLALPLLEDLPEAFDDESHLLIVELGGVNWKPLAWSSFFLLFLYCLKDHVLWLRCGGVVVGDVLHLFGVFNHKFKAHKLPKHLVESHHSVPRIFMK
jgi:hypothetical protein